MTALLWRETAFFFFQCLLLTSLHGLLFLPQVKALLQRVRWYPVLLAVLFVVQIGTAALYQREVIDVMIQAGAGWHLRHQIDFYFIDQGHAQHPYLPFMMFLFAGLNALQEHVLTGMTFSFLLKIVLFAATVVISEVIRRTHQSEGRLQQLRFLTHPLTTMVVLFHGQFDSVLLMFLILAAVLLSQSARLRNFLFGALLYVASVLSKTWSILFLPLLIWQEKVWWRKIALPMILVVGVLADVFVYTRIVDGSRIRAVLPAALKAGGPVGEWGLSFLFSPFVEIWRPYTLFLFAGCFGVLLLPILLRKNPLWTKMLLTVFAIYLAQWNWGVQYLFWALPFMYLAKQQTSRYFPVYTFFAAAAAFLSYINVIWGGPVLALLPIRLVHLIVWGCVAGWYYKLIRSRQSITTQHVQAVASLPHVWQ